MKYLACDCGISVLVGAERGNYEPKKYRMCNAQTRRGSPTNLTVFPNSSALCTVMNVHL